jgi:hypothetical protein
MNVSNTPGASGDPFRHLPGRISPGAGDAPLPKRVPHVEGEASSDKPPHTPGAGIGATIQGALVTQARVRQLTDSIVRLPLFRGLTRSQATDKALAAMVKEGRGTMPLLWGFQDSDHVSAAGIHTMQAFKECGQLMSVPVAPVLIMCDLHAAHNEIPEALADTYYRAAEAKAEELGIASVRLSTIYDHLGVTPSEIMALGKKLVQGPKGNAPGIPITLTGEEMGKLKQQARSLTNRYPGVFEERISQMTKKLRNEYFSNKALAYAQYRAGEDWVLKLFSQFFDQEGVLPTHIADQESAERIKVEGLFIRAKDANNETTINIPWGHDDVNPKGQ